ncbi:proteophosphoglycan ppg4 [Fibrobacter succinogenes subsp. succinogenes S85]|uniref:Proteophosphoglycan ppg4 n=2 Tax=Fibrobacter succinogenes (strain ATCC 19169 / S85) TaxID=59374 RepID=A0ABM5LLJ8_FIBSS|nr:hypothetical protein [Fibrobacter succinogenes]ACX76295.1 proteophosphoglycan ppg4 [Fibrobacter succinogenes subsp. succinogenes S85]
MKIEKKKVVKSSKLSHFTQSAVAAALGIAASIGATACDDSVSANSGDHPKQQPENEPTCGQAACGEQYSSSSYTDISSSGEHLSSEAIEALSSAMQPLSSSMVYPPPESGSPMVMSSERLSSSSVEKPSSSSYEPPPEAGILPPYEDSSSSETLSSSSEEKSSSSKTAIPATQTTPAIDTLNPRIHICDDGSCMIFSMVTTFEQDDIQA